MVEIQENVWGHKYRVDWIYKYLGEEEIGLEFGCGTGIMISGYLLSKGVNVYGLDIDEQSIITGRRLFVDNNIDPNRLLIKDIANVADNSYDFIIASEVFEHINKSDIDEIITQIRRKLKKGGKLFVTVPNGYGWSELESFIWKKLYVGKLFELVYIPKIINEIKKRCFKVEFNKFPSTVANSPHVRRFTYSSIQKLVADHGFTIMAKRGRPVFAGMFSSLFIGGLKPIMYYNSKLGKAFPKIASGFYIYALKK